MSDFLNIKEPGVYLMDKPKGWSSHDVVAKIRRLSGIQRVGHAGTLDPLATGLLIILVGREFTKRQPEFLKLDKEYICTAQLGIEMDTYDRTGTVVAEAAVENVTAITRDQVENILQKFVGTITQTVPHYSAIKVEGRKLYAKARSGETVDDLPQRQVTIQEIKLLDFDNETGIFSFTVSCSSGTYIRSLVNDIGKLLGVGAIVTDLRRIKIDNYDVANALNLNSR